MKLTEVPNTSLIHLKDRNKNRNGFVSVLKAATNQGYNKDPRLISSRLVAHMIRVSGFEVG